MCDDEFAVVRYILIFQYRLLYYSTVFVETFIAHYLYGQIRLHNRKMKVNKKSFWIIEFQTLNVWLYRFKRLWLQARKLKLLFERFTKWTPYSYIAP